MALDVPIQAAAAPSAPVAPTADAAPAPENPDFAKFLPGLESNPLVQAVRKGEAPAIYAPPSVFGDKSDFAVQALQASAPKLGLGFTQAPNAQAVVLFNPDLVNEQDILAADQDGTLNKIAVNVAKGGEHDPETPAGAQAHALAAGSPPASPQSIAGGLTSQLAPQSTPASITDARVAATLPTPPSRQANPSQGIINGLMKRAV